MYVRACAPRCHFLCGCLQTHLPALFSERVELTHVTSPRFPTSRESTSHSRTVAQWTTHTVVFSFTLVLDTLPGDSNHSLMLQRSLLTLSLLVTELFVLSPREQS